MRTRSITFWADPKNIETLRELWLTSGLSTAEIGRRMGLSKSAVIGKAGHIGLPSKPSPIIRDGRGRSPRAIRIQRAPAVTLPPLAQPVATPLVAAPPVIVAKPLPAPEPALLSSARVPAANECHWPFDKISPIAWRFCCARRTGDRIYCDHHRLISIAGTKRAQAVEAQP